MDKADGHEVSPEDDLHGQPRRLGTHLAPAADASMPETMQVVEGSFVVNITGDHRGRLARTRWRWTWRHPVEQSSDYSSLTLL